MRNTLFDTRCYMLVVKIYPKASTTACLKPGCSTRSIKPHNLYLNLIWRESGVGPFWLENELYIYLWPLHASDAVLIPAICKLLEEHLFFHESSELPTGKSSNSETKHSCAFYEPQIKNSAEGIAEGFSLLSGSKNGAKLNLRRGEHTTTYSFPWA